MLDIININQKEKWSSIVESFDDCDTYYQADYIEPFCDFEKNEAYLFYYKKDDFELCYPVEKSDIAHCAEFKGELEQGEYFDISVPYGYGGALVKNWDNNKQDKIIDFYNELTQWAKGNGIISQFFRFHPLLENHKYFENICNIKTIKQTVYMDLKDEDTIYKNLNDKCRNMIKKARKNNVEVKIDNSKLAQENFKKLYKETMQKNQARDFYYFNDEFYEKLFLNLGHDCNLFCAMYEGNFASIALIYEGRKFLHYHLSASNRDFSKFGANNLLLYEAGLYGSKKGLKKFHLGGGIEAQDGLFIFKKSFNKGGLVDFYIGANIFDKEKYDKLLNIRKSLDSSFDEHNHYMIQYRG